MRHRCAIALFAVITALVGCCDKDEIVACEHVRELSDRIDRHFRVMTTDADVNGYDLANKLMQDILLLPDEKKRKRLFEQWKTKALEFNYNALPIKHNDPGRGRSFSMMEDLFRHVFPRAASTEEEKWNIKLEYLGWLRRMAKDLSAKRDYPLGVYVSDQNRLLAQRGFRKALNEYRDWLYGYNWNSMVYEREMNWMESQFRSEEKTMNPEVKESIVGLIEGFLGRKLRTKKECEKDSYAKRRVEFPIFVPTADGLKYSWEGWFQWY